MRNIEFINAGAGSGKTFTLTSLLTEYLDGIKGNYQPSEVILTTFTELAAAEFREKAREDLLKKGKYKQAAHLETASIGTVHSVAFSFVKKFWYLLGRGAVQNVLSDQDRQFFINQSLANLATEEDVMFFEKIMVEFNYSKYTGKGRAENPDYWKEDLKKIIEKMVNYEIDDLDLSIKNSKKLINEIFDSNVDIDEKEVRDIFERYLQISGDQSKRKKVQNALSSESLRFHNLYDLGNISPAQKEIKQMPKLDDIQTNISAALRSQKYGEILIQYIERIFKLAGEWKREFEDYKAKKRLVDYNDMENLFLELLKKDEVRQEIKHRFKLVFVDEFQDSSPIQVKIFDKLSDLVEQSIWVGDPKQAIYGFRGSDTLLINAVTGMFDHEENNQGLIKGESLNKSYRSRNDLVKLSNVVFTRAFNDIKREDVALDVNRNDKIEFGNNPPEPLFHWHIRESNKEQKNRALAQKVVKLLQSNIHVIDKDKKEARPVQPEDIAVLCRDNEAVNTLANVLQDYGVKTTGQKADETFIETAEVKFFLAILNFLQNPYNRLAKAEILHLSDPQQYSVEHIITSRMDYVQSIQDDDEADKERPWEDDHPVIQKIKGLSQEVKSLPVPDMVERIITETDLKNRVASWGNHEKRQKNMDALVNHAMEYDQRCLQMGLGASLNNFIVYLGSLESQEQKAEKMEGSVNVLTYHKAKGLEWNLVIMESLEKDMLHDNNFIKRSFFGVNDMVTNLPTAENLYPERYIQLLPWFLGTKSNLPEDLKKFIKEKEQYKMIEKKNREEEKRLLYVGLTRARDYLVTVSYNNNPLKWIENIGGKKITPGNFSGNTIDVWDAGKEAHFETITGEDDFAGIQNEEQPKRLVRPGKYESFEERYISPSKVMEESAFDVTVLKNFEKRISLKAGKETEEAQIGNALHYIFYSYSKKENDPLAKAKSILTNLNMQSDFPEHQDIVTSIQNLYQFLESQYGPAEKIYKELPLQNFTEREQVIRGSIDLVWETKDGAVVVDYKSYPGGIKNITNKEDTHYAGIYGPQLLTYQKMLEAAGKNMLATCIYYAVMGVVADVHFSSETGRNL